MTETKPTYPDIYGRLVRTLGHRDQAWLARESGVPESTISTQLRSKRFSLDTLLRYAEALEVDVGWLIRGPLDGEVAPEKAREIVGELDRLLAGAKATQNDRGRR